MKIAIACLVAISVCSCKQCDSVSRKPADTTTRQTEVRRIISVYVNSGLDVVRGPLSLKEVDRELTELAKIESHGRTPEVTFKGPWWHELAAKFEPGDEFYFYRTDLHSWTILFGQQGYVLMRENDIIGGFITGVN